MPHLPYRVVQTEVSLIRSGDIAERVVTRLDLAKDPI